MTEHFLEPARQPDPSGSSTWITGTWTPAEGQQQARGGDTLEHPPAQSDGEAETSTRPPGRRRLGRDTARSRRRRVVAVLAAALALLLLPVLAMGAATVKVADDAVKSVRRIPNALPSGPDPTRPERVTQGAAANALNFLLIGTDARAEEPKPNAPLPQPAPDLGEASGRTDTMMVAHLSADRSKAYVISLPRDSWVDIPGHGRNKINAAYPWGGTQLLVRTVENLTHLHIDHVVMVDFAGFIAMSDAIGGVPVQTESGIKWMKGLAALNFVRERKNLLHGDFARVQRQQAFMRAVMNKALSTDTLTNPARLQDVLRAAGSAVSVDEGLDDSSLRGLLLSLRHLSAAGVHFMTVPVEGTGREQGLSVVRLDQERGATLWQAVREDTVDQWLQRNDTDVLGLTVDDPLKRRRRAKSQESAQPSASASPGASADSEDGDEKSSKKSKKSKKSTKDSASPRASGSTSADDEDSDAEN